MFSSLAGGRDGSQSPESRGALGDMDGYNDNWDLDAELAKLDDRETSLFAGIGIASDDLPSTAADVLDRLKDDDDGGGDGAEPGPQ
eukprot:SAG22_NODE_2524_length_2477_cov_1.834735_3_plen_85_part_01